MKKAWRRYEELRPDQLGAAVAEAPVCYWPLGLIEHHSWQLPVGFDGLKAERMCIRMAERTGGVMLPVMWWGGGGGHGRFKWTFYQEESAARSVLATTTAKLIDYGFRAIVLLAGHYPWQSLFDVVEPSGAAHPDVLIVKGTEMDIAGPEVKAPGDHAARAETSYGLALLAEFVDVAACRPGRGPESWPGGSKPEFANPDPRVDYDPASPTFAQWGDDPRKATAEEAEPYIERIVAAVTAKIAAHLAST